ncbi:MAG: hypothetical protein P8O06_02565 [Porticoccaceae bacterium]|nr:hypothetical protein [Porticoccaceae bacterium]
MYTFFHAFEQMLQQQPIEITCTGPLKVFNLTLPALVNQDPEVL